MVLQVPSAAHPGTNPCLKQLGSKEGEANPFQMQQRVHLNQPPQTCTTVPRAEERENLYITVQGVLFVFVCVFLHLFV